ncbi:MAG: N-formylglutamate amidohydrolase [Sandaracinaceae bacterium]|nr:N-formylglutamate amidohydrolase [Sandaracinaceae bacterium]
MGIEAKELVECMVKPVECEEAYEVYAFGEGAEVVFTCEHASEEVPPGFAERMGFRWPEADSWLRGTHWAYDIGAKVLALELAACMQSQLVCARFSRLLVDPNRPPEAETIFRNRAEGKAIVMNTNLSPKEREARMRWLYEPFHAAVEAVVARERRARTVLALHTFTPEYEGQRRHVEVGVLFNRDEDLAHRLIEALRREGFVVGANEPWSGKDGLIYVAERHAERFGKQAIDIEVRQDLVVDPSFRARLTRVVGEALG